MASEKKILKASHGVTLTEVSLRNGGAIVDCGYVVQTRRSPEVWTFGTLSEAEVRYGDEVSLCAN